MIIRKDLSLIILMVLICNSLFSQTQIPNTIIWNTVDKVGINNPTPNASLDVLGKAKFRGLNGVKQVSMRVWQLY